MAALKPRTDVQQTVAPTAEAPRTPTERLKSSMTPPAWQVVLDMMAWAQHWQMVYDGQVPEWTEELTATMLRPMTGFGPHPEVWQLCIRAGVARDLVVATFRWLDDAAFRKANPFPWLVLSIVAPILAYETRQVPGSRECHAALAELEGITEIIDTHAVQPQQPPAY